MVRGALAAAAAGGGGGGRAPVGLSGGGGDLIGGGGGGGGGVVPGAVVCGESVTDEKEGQHLLVRRGGCLSGLHISPSVMLGGG